MRHSTAFKTILTLAGAFGVATGCSGDPATAPASESALVRPVAPSASLTAGATTTASQSMVGDTAVFTFTVGTNTTTPTTVVFGDDARITFPYSSGSICDPHTSSYGAGTWNAPCSATTRATTITVKVWRNAQGQVASDFKPALRFMPGVSKPVTLYLRDHRQLSNTRIAYCAGTSCVDEGRTDASMVTYRDSADGIVYRVIKHFSGYTVTAD